MRSKSINYLEARTINIGDYEKIVSQLSYTVEINHINNVESTATISHIEHENVGDSFKEAVTKVVGRVKSVLNARELDIRRKTSSFVDFDTDSKADLLKTKKKPSRDLE
jgi:hypothetical protein